VSEERRRNGHAAGTKSEAHGQVVELVHEQLGERLGWVCSSDLAPPEAVVLV
jgi:hypothetical protein